MTRRFLRLALLLAGALALVGCAGAPPATPLGYLVAPPGGRFLHVSSADPTGGNHDMLEIAPGDSAVLLDLAGPGIVRRLWITVASDDPHYLRRIALKMYWEGESTPSVAAPLGDFFGDGFAKKHYTALVMGESSGGFYCYLPMPFARHARIVAENGTGRRIQAFYYNIDLVTGVRLPRPVETLHAWWHRDPRTTARAPHLLVDARGRGAYVGTSLNVQSLARNLGFLEGDEIFTVDGQPRGQGTGTEDYFNSGWYFDEGTFAGAFHGLVIKDDTLGRIAAYRWHLPDPIPFERSLHIAIEHGTENTEVADYATMAYWYQTEPHAPLPPLPPANERRVASVIVPPDVVPADSAHPVRRGAGAGVRLSLPVPRPDRYTVEVYPAGAAGAGTATFQVADAPPRTVSLAGAEPGTPLPPVTLGPVAADDSIRIEATPPPAGIRAVPLRQWAADWNVVGPFAAPGLADGNLDRALAAPLEPERNPALDASYAVDGARAAWRPAHAQPDGRIDLKRLYTPGDWVLAYGQAFLYSPDARAATLLLGADDGHVLWLNGEKVSERTGRHPSVPDEVVIPVQLRAGWNRVLIKDANLDGGWAFQLRAADPRGELRWSATPQP